MNNVKRYLAFQFYVEGSPEAILAENIVGMSPTRFVTEFDYLKAHPAPTVEPRVREALEELKEFVRVVTLHLQSAKTFEQNTRMFQRAYFLYNKYDVEGWHAKQAHAALAHPAAQPVVELHCTVWNAADSLNAAMASKRLDNDMPIHLTLTPDGEARE